MSSLAHEAAEHLIVGGGVIGLSLAFELLERGRSVVVLERDEPGHGASDVAAGMLAPVSEADTGPDAVPPPLSSSADERSEDRFEPAPEPYLNNMPSVLASPRIDSIESSTALMKQAEHWGSSSTPTLNQTGELNAIFWCNNRCTSSSRNAHASASVLK